MCGIAGYFNIECGAQRSVVVEINLQSLVRLDSNATPGKSSPRAD